MDRSGLGRPLRWVLLRLRRGLQDRGRRIGRICHLDTGDGFIHVNNYKEVVKPNLFEKLKKGEAGYAVESLFELRPYVADVYKKYVM